jgi:hypothetical protein
MMHTKNDIYAIIEDLKKVLPSFYSIPVSSDEEARIMDEKKIVGAIVLQDGKFKDHIIILRSIEFKGSKIEIDYTAVDKDKNNVESEELNDIVGNLINYFLAMEKLRKIDRQEDA